MADVLLVYQGMNLARVGLVLMALLCAPAVYAVDSCHAMFAPHSGGVEIVVSASGNRAQVTLPSGDTFGMYLTAKRVLDENDPEINCHGYACALSHIPNLPHGWVDGSGLNKILKNYFFRTETIESHLGPSNGLDVNLVDPERALLSLSNSKVRDGDLVVFKSGAATTHTGVIEKRMINGQTEVWIRSKFGDARMWVLKVDDVARAYPGDKIEIWRRK